MEIRHTLVVAITAALVLSCDDGGDEIRFEETAPRETAPMMEEPSASSPRDTTPPTAEEIAAAEAGAGAAEEGPEANREESSGAGTVAARSLGEAVYTVQIGAFSRDAAASDLVARVEAAGLPIWHSDTQIGGRAYRRVRVGALTSRAEAERLAERLRSRHGVSTWVVQVSPDTPLPAGIVERTLSALSRG